MALPPSAASALAADMPGKGFGAVSKGAEPSEPTDDDSSPDIMQEIAGDVIDAIQAGSKDEAAKFLVELIERMTDKGSAPSMPGE
jgi:hypothetical protein